MNNFDGVTAFPLCWPEGWKRTRVPWRSRFKITAGQARDKLLDEIRRMSGIKPIISTNLPIRNDGLPYASARQPSDAGVAVYFQHRQRTVVLACDRWQSTTENIWAIAKTIEALRGIERWGASELLERAFTGFQALPPGRSEQAEEWWTVLELPLPTKDFEVLKKQRNALARKFHPDMGETPDADQMARINRAYEKAMKGFGNGSSN